MPYTDWINWAEASAVRILLAAAVAALLALIAHRAGAAVLHRVTRGSPVATAVIGQIHAPAQFLLPLMALQAVWQAAPDSFPLIGGIRHANGLLLIATLTWLGVRAVRGVARGVVSRHPVTVEDNLNARRIQTQAQLLARTAMFIVFLTGLALMLMTFPGARQFGASLLASAGVVGLVAGIAARPVFSNLIAGLQIALAQPIRLDDVLIVQGEWGRVEEITGTYVVLAIWDQRRLIIPLQWFIENPFQNWTRKSAELIGTVFMWVDYRMPLAPLREAAQAACKASRNCDGRLCLLQVVEAGEKAMQLRWLVTSASSGQNWDLRCEVREAVVDFVQREYPQFLPQLRAEVAGAPPPPSAPPRGDTTPSPMPEPSSPAP